MQIQRVDTREEFEQLRSDWDRIYAADAQATLFQSWRWLAQTLPRRNNGWCVLVVRPEPGKPAVGLFPLRLDVRWSETRQRFVNDLHMAGSYSWADYTGFICEPEHEKPVIAALAHAVKQMTWTSLHLRHFNASGERRERFFAHFDNGNFTIEQRDGARGDGDYNNTVCPGVKLPGDFEAYLASLSANSRQKIRKLLRMLDSDPQLQIVPATRDTFDRDVDIMMDFWRQTWSERKGKKTDRLINRYRGILRDALKGDMLFMPMLWRSGEPLGGIGNFIDEQQKSMLYFVAGRDETCDSPPPGLLLHAWSIRWAIENGLSYYDFLRGNEAFKYSFGASDRPISNHIIRSLQGHEQTMPLDRKTLGDLFALIESYENDGRQEIADIGYRQLLFADRRNIKALSGFGSLLYAQERFEEACFVASNRVELEPENPAALRQFGRAALGAGRLAEARDALRKAVALEPTISGHHYLARTLQALHLADEAARQWQAMLTLEARGKRELRQQQEAREMLEQQGSVVR